MATGLFLVRRYIFRRCLRSGSAFQIIQAMSLLLIWHAVFNINIKNHTTPVHHHFQAQSLPIETKCIVNSDAHMHCLKVVIILELLRPVNRQGSHLYSLEGGMVLATSSSNSQVRSAATPSPLRVTLRSCM